MAYFSNGSEGECFTHQCTQCKYGDKPCPIAGAQLNFNYDACNNKTARAILDSLVSDSGECSMFNEFKEDLELVDGQSNAEAKEAPLIFLKKVETLDCIKENDQLVLESESEVIETVIAAKIKHSKSDGTEVIFDMKNNRYFNLGMYLEGESWVSRVYVIKSK